MDEMARARHRLDARLGQAPRDLARIGGRHRPVAGADDQQHRQVEAGKTRPSVSRSQFAIIPSVEATWTRLENSR